MRPIVYLSGCPQLPATAPVGHSHLVKIESVDKDVPYPQPGLGIPDLVATALFNHDPDILQRFLDSSHDFRFWIGHTEEGRDPEIQVIRKGSTVKASDAPTKCSSFHTNVKGALGTSVG